MSKRPCSVSSAVLLTVCLLGPLYVAPAEAASPSDPPSESAPARRWQPGAALFIGGLPDLRKASGDSDTLGFQDGETVGLPWTVRGSAEMASPVVFDAPVATRFFAHAGGGWVYDPDDPVTSQGDPGSPPFEPQARSEPEAIENVGSAVRVQAKSWQLTGGLGAILEIEAFDRTIYVRPSLEWMYRRDTVRAILGGGENADPNPPPIAPVCNPCRTVFIDAEREKGFHSLGPGIAVEMDGPRQDDFELRFFASFAAFHVLGDRDAEFAPSETWVRSDGMPPVRTPPETTYRVRYEREPWHYRFGVGLRLVWHGL